MDARINVPKPPPQDLSRPVTAYVLHTDQHVTCTIRYNKADPYEVAFQFRDCPWVFDRNLLRDGLARPVGDGDVHIAPSGDDEYIVLALNSPNGHVDLIFSTADLREAVDAIYELVPPGDEQIDLDELIAMILVGTE